MRVAPSDLSDRSFELCNFNQAQFYPSLRLRNWRDKVLIRTLNLIAVYNIVLCFTVIMCYTLDARSTAVRNLPGRRSLRSRGTNRLLVPPVKRSTVGSRAFPVAGPKAWNALPEDITSSQCDYAFRRQLKTWIFKKSFPDII